jgi:hypothetical protein
MHTKPLPEKTAVSKLRTLKMRQYKPKNQCYKARNTRVAARQFLALKGLYQNPNIILNALPKQNSTPLPGSSEHGSEFSGSIKGKINSEQMSDCQFLKCTLLHGGRMKEGRTPDRTGNLRVIRLNMAQFSCSLYFM